MKDQAQVLALASQVSQQQQVSQTQAIQRTQTSQVAVLPELAGVPELLHSQSEDVPKSSAEWRWPIDISRYDCTPSLSMAESAALQAIIMRDREVYRTRWPHHAKKDLGRLLNPLNDVLAFTAPTKTGYWNVMRGIVAEMHARQTSFWAWTQKEWLEILQSSSYMSRGKGSGRQHVTAVAYLLCSFTDLYAPGSFCGADLALKVFGSDLMDAAVQRVGDALLRLGYGTFTVKREVTPVLSAIFLINRSPYLEGLTLDMLDEIRKRDLPERVKSGMLCVSRALASMGIVHAPLNSRITEPDMREHLRNPNVVRGVAQEWVYWCHRWRDTSTLSPTTRQAICYQLLKVGRWLAQEHPSVVSPDQWTRGLAAEFIAAVDRMKIGQWLCAHVAPDRLGKPLTPRAKETHFKSVCTFFRDCQEWGWIPRRFDPRRCFSSPRSIRSLVAPNPRVIEDDVWAKLLWAGLNLSEDDLPRVCLTQRQLHYPLKMARALAMVWLFTGLRSDEIYRLRVGCVRWDVNRDKRLPIQNTQDIQGGQATQGEDGRHGKCEASGLAELVGAAGAVGGGKPIVKNRVCWLDVPVNKTSTAFCKPVDWPVGVAIAEWEHIRPEQPSALDPKTGELVQYLFSCRSQRVGRDYLNSKLIPTLCRKAGVPESDTRGHITSHRARSTIATQLFNSREPMSLAELQEWLGHRSPQATQHYAKIKPTKLARSYERAGYFGRNLRTIEVLIDKDAVSSGTAAQGEPWRFYDLGHGYCTYDFFDQCPHRMACAKCAFYQPKGSGQAQILEAKSNLLKMKQEIPLTEEERAAVEDGLEALEKLCEQLADVPTPAGPTPKQLTPTLTLKQRG